MSAPQGWVIPEKQLTPKGRSAAEAILAFLREKNLTDHGGGGGFYGPEQWEERGEEYGLGSLLIVIHDGGEHAPAFNWDYEDYNLVEELRLTLQKIGVYVEQCTSWFSAIYPIQTPKELP